MSAAGPWSRGLSSARPSSERVSRSSGTRLDAIDWARGLAVLIMIQAHVTDAWTRPADRTTTAYRYLTVLGGFAAPLFLWLAGLSLVLSGEALLRQGTDRRQAWQRLVQRGLEVFILAFLFRANSFLFNPGGAALTLFRVDILNVMGPAMVVTGLLWAVSRSRTLQVLMFGGVAVGLAMLTPVVRTAAWVDRLPVWFQWYLRPAAEHTVFTLLPWGGFVLAGAASGVLVARAHLPQRRVQVRLALGLAGLAILGLGFYTASLPTIYRQSSFWTSSPTFFAVRAGILLLALALLDGTAALLTPRGVSLAALGRLGRGSLLIYWIHVQLAYGWATWPLRKRLSLPQLLVAYLVFTIAMYALLPLRDRLVAAWRRRLLQGARAVALHRARQREPPAE